MWLRCKPHAHLARRLGRFAVAASSVLFWGCGQEAWLGLQCPREEPSCAVEQDAARDVSGGAPAPGSALGVRDAGSLTPPGAAGEAPTNDAQVPAAEGCRSVSMGFFACARGDELPGAPWLLADRAYTLRLRGSYALDTVFQVRGGTASCTALEFDSLTVAAGAESAEGCIRPPEDVALLVTVMSGDPAVWVDGLLAEVCDGCP